MTRPRRELLIQDLKKEFENVAIWIRAQDEHRFNQKIIPGKWTIAGHLYHLIKSTKAVSNGMAMSKEQLAGIFGKNNRTERTYEEMLEKYEEALHKNKLKAPDAYQAETDRQFDRSTLIERFEGELRNLILGLESWNEEDLGVYIMPHPALGKCTMREFIYFTILHTAHHLEVLKQKYNAD